MLPLPLPLLLNCQKDEGSQFRVTACSILVWRILRTMLL
jgi:hypothetical protein